MPKKDEKHIPITVRIDAKLHARLELVAEHLGLKLADVVRHCIRGGIESIEAQDCQIYWPPTFRINESPINRKLK